MYKIHSYQSLEVARGGLLRPWVPNEITIYLIHKQVKRALGQDKLEK